MDKQYTETNEWLKMKWNEEELVAGPDIMKMNLEKIICLKRIGKHILINNFQSISFESRILFLPEKRNDLKQKHGERGKRVRRELSTSELFQH